MNVDIVMPSDPGPDELLRLIGENAIDAIAVIDRAGRYVYANPAHQRLFGMTDAPLEQRIAHLIHPDDRERVRGMYLEILATGRSIRAEYRIVRPDGATRNIEVQSSIVAGGDAGIGHIITISRDLTDQRHTEQSLRLRESQLNELRAMFNVGTWDWDMRDDVITWSPEMREIFGVDAAFKPTMASILSMARPLDPELEKKLANGELHIDKLHRVPYLVFRPDGKVRMVELNGTVNYDRLGQPQRMAGIVQDITERKYSENQARMSEERFRVMIENAREYAIYMLDPGGHIVSWNSGAERITGFTSEEIIGCHYSCFFIPDHVELGLPASNLELARTRGRYECEGWRVRKNGSRYWARTILMPFTDERGNLQGFSNIAHDITERRRAKENLREYAERLRATSRRLVEIQEMERRQLATELHDRVGQNLTALGINLSLISRELPADAAPLQSRVQESGKLLRQTIESMRNVMAELRPQALDDYGLFSALRLAMSDFTKRTGIKSGVTGRDISEMIPKTVGLAMFRIFQETLHNVIKHAQATAIEIRLDEADNIARLEIRDNGTGFDVARIEALRPAQRWGLQIMRERAEAVGAVLTIEASPDCGTCVIVTYRI